jgi:hypothetical protein
MAQAKVMVTGVLADDGKKCLIIFMPDGKKSLLSPIRSYFTRGGALAICQIS